jgi:Xaa-Pro aminopeptidase
MSRAVMLTDGGREERVRRITCALEREGLDGVVCALAENVVMLSGYWPVVGTSLAVATRSGRIGILAPEDERDLAESGWADLARTYSPGSLDRLGAPWEAAAGPMAGLLGELDLTGGTLGCEDGATYEASTYAAMYLFGASMESLLRTAAPGARTRSARGVLMCLRAALTPWEVSRVQQACRVAEHGFEAGKQALRAGATEAEIATAFAAPMEALGRGEPDVRRAAADVWCMSGPHSALAGKAYARTRDRTVREGDLVLVHCNSCLDGYWTDITRTYCLGTLDERTSAMYDAIFAARQAALDAIKPGVRAAGVDRAGREILEARGFGRYFTHAIGHNVGFSVISAEYPPRLHPRSPDRLEVGMTFNLEPAIYIAGFGGVRHCDVVTLGEAGPEVLTRFQATIDELTLPDC